MNIEKGQRINRAGSTRSSLFVAAAVAVLFVVGPIVTALHVTSAPSTTSTPDEPQQELVEKNTRDEREKRYFKEDNGVFYGDKVLPKVDLSTFQILDSHFNHYAKDIDHVYYKGNVIPEADPESFTLLKYNYAKDDNYAYYKDKIITEADVKTFSILKMGEEDIDLAVDKNYIYYESNILADANTFEYVIDSNLSAEKALVRNIFAKDKDNVFVRNFVHSGYEYETLNLNFEIDLDELEIVYSDHRSEIFKDEERVYYLHPYLDNKVSRIQNAHAPTFHDVGLCSYDVKSNGRYFRDKNRIYVDDEPIESIDVSTFTYYGTPQADSRRGSSYAKDKNAVYVGCGSLLENADPDTFQVFEDSYAKDKDTVWWNGYEIEGADASSFQALGENYAKDSNHVYYSETERRTTQHIEEADPATFQLVEKYAERESGSKYHYAKDKNNVYWSSILVEGVDPDDCCTLDTLEKWRSEQFQ